MSLALAAGIAAGGSLLGGLLGARSQSQANAQNLAIARETNASNERINEANLAWQREALKSQQQYASFENQLAMARAAGVNPYLAMGNQTAASGGGTPVSHAMQAAHVEPVNAFASALGRSGVDMANVMSLIASANKSQEEAKGQSIDNITKGAINAAQLDSLGKTIEAQTIRNRLSNDTYDAQVENAKLINAHLEKENVLFDIEKDIKTFTKDKILPEQLRKILQEIKLIQEKGLTEQSQRSLNDALAKAHITSANAAMIQAKVQQSIAPSQIGLNKAMAANQMSQVTLNEQHAEFYRQENSIKRSFGGKIADAMLEQINKGNLLTDASIEKIYSENKYIQQQYDLGVFKAIIGSLLPIAGISKVLFQCRTP